MKNNWIAKNGETQYAILLPEDALPHETYAAKELQYYLSRITQASIDIITQITPDKPVLAIGAAAFNLNYYFADKTNKAAAPIKKEITLEPDAFHIITTGSNLLLTGGKRGLIYAVYELLEHWGCRFFTPECEKIPLIPDLLLPDLDNYQKPHFEYRYHNYKDFIDYPRFAVKNRINGPVPIKEKFGGHISYIWFVHSFESCILDPDEWFDEHPEYFSMVDGKRLRHRTQLCLTNSDVLDITIKKVRQAISDNPDKNIISVSQNDWYNPCSCPECKRIDDQEHSQAGSLIWFINQVAQEIEIDYPDIIIDTLAYQYSRQAPVSIRPRHNVCVRLCTIEACFAHALDKCDDKSRQITSPAGIRSSFAEDLSNWAKVCDRLYIWDYTTCFAHYPAPFPNWNVLQPNMQIFARNNVRGVFEQACGAKGGGVDMNEMRAYLIAKLLWDPDCDFNQHLEEFAAHYYGDAAHFILSYIHLLCDTVKKENIHVGFNDQTNAEYLTENKLSKYSDLLNQAYTAVSDQTLYARRVQKILLSIRWVRIKNKAMLENSFDFAKIHQFFNDWHSFGLTRIDEWVSAETTYLALLKGIWRGTELYADWDFEGKEEL